MWAIDSAPYLSPALVFRQQNRLMSIKRGTTAPFLSDTIGYGAQSHFRFSATNKHPPFSKLRLHFLRSSKPNTLTSTTLPILTPPIKPNNNNNNNTNLINKRKNKKKNKGNRSSCSNSDILRLMDGLKVPVADPPPPPLHLLNRLLLRHVSNGRLDNARQLFDEMPMKDFNSWATLIAAYAHNADYPEALRLFLRMLHHSVDMFEFPSWIMACVVDACARTMEMRLGEQVHGCCVKLGHDCRDMFVAVSLINFYCRLRRHEAAHRASIGLSQPNALTWTARMINNSRGERFLEVISDFKEVGRAGISKDACMVSCVLKACAKADDRGLTGRQVHADAIKLGVESHSFVHCGLVDMYGRNGLLRDAKLVFQTTNDTTSTACWNAMLTSYLRHGLHIEALKFLYQMKADGLQPQEYLLDQVRIACASNVL